MKGGALLIRTGLYVSSLPSDTDTEDLMLRSRRSLGRFPAMKTQAMKQRYLIATTQPKPIIIEGKFNTYMFRVDY